MMVIFVSQCEKKALNRTRRVLDAFADRIGDNTWQTVITEDGLQAVRKLLRKTASKSTAVSCHWLRSRSRSDLIWAVGRRDAFNYQGLVPVNHTRRDILNSQWENSWRYASVIQIMATLAALLHDLGKATLGFQGKLLHGGKQADPYRHEWLSLKLFLWLIKDCKTDEQWLQRFENITEFLEQTKFESVFLQEVEKDKVNLDLPPLAQWLAWLIVSHHRLPPLDAVFYSSKEKTNLRKSINKLGRNQANFYKRIKATDYWVKNPKAVDECAKSKQDDFWKIDNPVIASAAWQKHLKRWAGKALKDTALMQLSEANETIANPLLLHLSRLCLMLGDHNYSSLAVDDKRRVKGSQNFTHLAANTDRETGEIKQPLDEHLIGVAKFTSEFARKLPVIADAMPRLEQHQPLQKHAVIKRFKWQNKAYEQAQQYQKQTVDNGFFGVNMASTGCGKTIGNARIMYALADPNKGARFTIALGLRVLTLQTGQSLRDDLKLDDDQLAVLVGGTAHKELFEYKQDAISAEKEQETYGSESMEELLSEQLDGDVNIDLLAELGLGTVIESAKTQKLLAAPIVSCTVDHLIQASECKRGGKFIAPMLRLLSSDLILDEPDDFDHEDLPALARLVHLAGMLGARVLLSSATLPPDLVEGLFKAYKTGREIYNQSQSLVAPQVVCAWFDENDTQIKSTAKEQEFADFHQQFIAKRKAYLNKQITQRKADILPIKIAYQHEQQTEFFEELAHLLIEQSLTLHDRHHTVYDNRTTVSVGLIRIANINNIVALAQAMYALDDIDEHTVIHLCCYHAKQLLVLRNQLEERLDRILKRKEDDPDALFEHSEIINALKNSQAKRQIFIVMATPVAEVGRDHDYDWAIVEPSSMRSIIQLAGRVWRHRPNKVAVQANMAIMQYNIRSLKNNHDSGQPVFIRPGFENDDNRLETQDMLELLSNDFLEKIDASARVIKSKELQPTKKLADLEQNVMQSIMNNQEVNYVNAYWRHNDTSQRSHTFLQTISEFRRGQAQDEWLVIPNEDENMGFYSAEQVRKNRLVNSKNQNNIFTINTLAVRSKNIKPWLGSSLIEALETLQSRVPDKSLRSLAIRYATVQLEESEQGWNFNEALGFWRKR